MNCCFLSAVHLVTLCDNWATVFVNSFLSVENVATLGEGLFARMTNLVFPGGGGRGQVCCEFDDSWGCW